MSNALNDRLAARYSPKVLNELRTVKLTAAGLRDAEPDIYEWLVLHRGEEVEGILNAAQVTAKRKAAKTSDELAVFYAECRNGVHTPNQIAAWLKENFEEDFTRFNQDFPHVCGEQTPSNMTAITADIAARRVFPTYGELVTSFGRLAIPDKGYPTLTLKCGGDYLTGKPLRDYIRAHPLEMLNAPKQARPAHETMSASEFLKNSPELQDNSQPALLKERFQREWRNFLAGDIGRALKVHADQHGLGSFLPEMMWNYMAENGVHFTQKGFEQAALAETKKIIIHKDNSAAPLELSRSDINGGRTQGLELHDGGGSHHTQHSLRATMAGQIKPDAAEDTHVYSEAETRRLVRKLGSIEYRQLLNDSPNFRRAVDTYLGGA